MPLRTFPRNFPGRSGTKDDRVYLCSPETAAAAGLFGVLTDPRELATLMPWPDVQNPNQYLLDDSSIIFPLPPEEASKIEIVTGPNIVPFPDFAPLPDDLEAELIIKVGDNITTDHIMPAGNKVLPLRSNIPAISEYVFEQLDPGFPARAKAAAGGIVVGGENYQGVLLLRDLIVRPFEVVTLLDFLARLVDGVVDLLHVDFGDYVETGHDAPPLRLIDGDRFRRVGKSTRKSGRCPAS